MNASRIIYLYIVEGKSGPWLEENSDWLKNDVYDLLHGWGFNVDEYGRPYEGTGWQSGPSRGRYRRGAAACQGIDVTEEVIIDYMDSHYGHKCVKGTFEEYLRDLRAEWEQEADEPEYDEPQEYGAPTRSAPPSGAARSSTGGTVAPTGDASTHRAPSPHGDAYEIDPDAIAAREARIRAREQAAGESSSGGRTSGGGRGLFGRIADSIGGAVARRQRDKRIAEREEMLRRFEQEDE